MMSTFITLDDKEECVGIYSGGELTFEEIPEGLTRTWKYSPSLKNLNNIEYAYFISKGKGIGDVCPEHLKSEWELLNKRLLAYFKSFRTSKINLEDNCFYDLVPKQFLLEFCELKCQIIDYVFEHYEKLPTYDFSVSLEKMLMDIKKNTLNIDITSLDDKRYSPAVRTFIKNIDSYTKNIDFNQYGTKTGRLTTRTKTFPILNLKSEYRSIIKPKNDYFLEFDFNAAELRVLLSLAGKEQPNGDIHEWNAQRLGLSREEAKEQVFAWLYGSSQVDGKKFSDHFETKKVLDKYYNGKEITNYFGRTIPTDDYHALNHLIQSTTSDMVLRQVLKVNEILKDRKSFIWTIIHDSFSIDASKTDNPILRDVASVFSNNEFGIFPVRTSIGKDFGSLKKVV